MASVTGAACSTRPNRPRSLSWRGGRISCCTASNSVARARTCCHTARSMWRRSRGSIRCCRLCRCASTASLRRTTTASSRWPACICRIWPASTLIGRLWPACAMTVSSRKRMSASRAGRIWAARTPPGARASGWSIRHRRHGLAMHRGAIPSSPRAKLLRWRQTMWPGSESLPGPTGWMDGGPTLRTMPQKKGSTAAPSSR